MAGALSQFHFLIVDDSAHIRRLVVAMLRCYGCTQISEARTAQQALEVLNRAPAVDIALIDWMLAESQHNGTDLVKHIRRSPHDHLVYLPIIMMTGHTDRENIETARDAGITEFLAKPFTAKGLHTRLVNLIEQPRPFVRTSTFFGPDRRRRTMDPPTGEERRLSPARREKTR